MANSDVKRCMDWLSAQKEAIEGEMEDRGGREVTEVFAQQRKRSQEIVQYRAEVDKALNSQKISEETKKELDSTYKMVLALSKKREGCLETVSQIAGSDDLVQSLSNEFDSKAQHLVNAGESCREVATTDHSVPELLSNEALAKASQNCIQAVRVNWRWLSQLMQCSQTHLKNAAAYHEFFHELGEAEHWMNATLSRIHLTFDPTQLQGNRSDALAIQNEIKDVLSAFLHWQTKTDHLYDKATGIVPVPQRTTTLKEERTVLALTDFSNSQITFIEGEVLFLMDNEDRKKWKVRNNAGQVGVVPAVIVLIPPPHAPATETALRLRRQLLALWTGSVKRLGYQLIAFMLLVFRDWNQEEVSLLQRLSDGDRAELLRVLEYLESTLLQQSWQGYGDFQELQERIHRLVMIAEEASDDPDLNNDFLKTVVLQVKTLEDLLKKYQDFWTFWETFKTIVELVKQPELLLVCDKWDQLNYRSTAHVVKFWDTSLDLAEGDMTKQTASLALQETPTGVISDVTIAEEHQESATTETVSTSVIEEQYTFIVTGVLDPRDSKSELDLQTAIMLGIVDQAQGLYINPLTGESITMREAMNEGKLMLQALSKKKLSEEKQSYGLLTIRSTRENRPYTIHGVRDPSTNRVLTAEEATQRGVLTSSSYRTSSGVAIGLSEAIEQGLLDVTYDQDRVSGTPEIVSKTYAVHAVVDQKNKQKVSFTDAVQQGLLNRDTGEYLHNVTQELLPAHVAIMRGFIKARFVPDPSHLDIDPQNRIVIQKFQNAKKKLMQEIHTIKAFKSMVKRN